MCIIVPLIGEYLYYIFYLINAKRIILLIRASDFISFGPIECFLDISEVGKIIIDDPVLR